MIADLMDDDGENRAIRMFLAYYGGNRGISVFNMKYHLRMAGFDKAWPAWCDEPGEDKQHLTKAGAQLWIRHLISLEPVKAPVEVRQDGMPISKKERLFRRMLCLQRHPHGAYMDDGEASFGGDEHHRSIDYMRETPEAIQEAWLEAGRKQVAELATLNWSQCSNTLRLLGKSYPRTCKECGITGPCKFPTTAQETKSA